MTTQLDLFIAAALSDGETTPQQAIDIARETIRLLNGGDTTPPSKVTGLSAKPEKGIGGYRVEMSWQSAIDEESGISHYIILRDGKVLKTNIFVTAATDATVSGSRSYTYQVVAVNGDGLQSLPSDTVNVKIPDGKDTTPPSPVTGLSAVAVKGVDRYRVELSWNPSVDEESGIDYYVVTKNGSVIMTPDGINAFDALVKPGETYSYSVHAVNTAGMQGEPATKNVTIPKKPPPWPDLEGWYVSADGRDSGSGTKDSPWSLQAAVAKDNGVKPGDTVWFMQGRYLPDDHVDCLLKGEPAKDIICRPAPEHEAIIDLKQSDGHYLWFNIDGTHNTWRDFDFTNSDPASRITPAYPDIYRRGSIEVDGDHISIINCRINNLMKGLSFWERGKGGYAYGNVIMNCGTQEPSGKFHGHGFYCQNFDDHLTLEHNIIASIFRFGIHIFGGQGHLNNIHVTENVCANNNGEFLIGGGRGARDCVVEGNRIFGGMHLDVDAANHRFTVQDNYVYNGELRFTQTVNESLVLTGNTVYQPRPDWLVARHLRYYSKPLPDWYEWDNNRYFSDNPKPFALGKRSHSFEPSTEDKGWLELSGVDANSTLSPGPPPDGAVLWQNLHDENKATLVVHNWSGAATTTVDISAWADRCLASHVYKMDSYVGSSDGGTLTVLNRAVVAPSPIGDVNRDNPVMPKEYGIFLLQKTS